ncbi:MAG: hypothetical protein ABSC62_11410 [Terracidiphilus sp.]|jgi:hypothetical protein
MKVLVDYHNVPTATSHQGLAYLADRILTKVSSVAEPTGTLDLRLYGGWDSKNRMTRQGQDLSVEMQSIFPKTQRIGQVQVILTMQLAQSLEALPSKTLPNTLREEPLSKIKCQTPSKTTCRSNPCPIDPMAVFLNSGACPLPGCIAEPHMLLSRTEQKLVDTMIVADLIHLAGHGETPIALVSSDDDMWPGILCALNVGANVIHLHTRAPITQTAYLTQTNGQYTPIGL